MTQHPHIGFSYAEVVHTLTVRRFPASLALAATLLVAFVMLFAWPQSASAHDTLIASDPAADSTIDVLPEELTLTFSAGLIGGDGSTAVVVADEDGNSITDGEPTVDGAMVIQPLTSEAAAGEYTVSWQVVSSDGHPTDGEFSFTLSTGTAAEESDATTSPAPDATASETPVAPLATTEPEPGQSADDGFMRALPWIIGGAILAVGGGVLIGVMMRRGRDDASDSDTPPER